MDEPGKTRLWLKIAGSVTGAVLVLVLAGWLVFVPGASGPEYGVVQTWGEPGDQPGQFDDPTGLAVTADEVFVSDARNARIQVFDHEGVFRRHFGTHGDKAGELARPMNLALAGQWLYVPEYFNDRIQVFSLDGVSRKLVGESGYGPGEFDAPAGVTRAPNGDLLVADFYNHRVQRLSPEGELIRQWGKTAQPGKSAGEFNYPTDVAVAQNGRIYVADGYNHRIQVFDSDGDFLHKWGGPLAWGLPGPFNGWFNVVTSIALGPEGRVFAADFHNNRVQVFTAEGEFLTSFGQTGSGAGEFDHAMAVDVAPDGTVFVADFHNNRVQEWKPGVVTANMTLEQ